MSTTEGRTAQIDTTALKALAHPERLRMLGMLRFDGPDTATGLARRLGLNSGATSYHLRQLQKYGFIEPADDIGNKRDRYWRAMADDAAYDPTKLEGDAQQAAMAMVAGLISQHILLMQRALTQFPEQPPEWQAASNVSDYTYTMSADEALAFKEKLTAMLWEQMQKSPQSGEPGSPDEKQFMVMLHAFPFPGIEGAKGAPSKRE